MAAVLRAGSFVLLGCALAGCPAAHDDSAPKQGAGSAIVHMQDAASAGTAGMSGGIATGMPKSTPSLAATPMGGSPDARHAGDAVDHVAVVAMDAGTAETAAPPPGVCELSAKSNPSTALAFKLEWKWTAPGSVELGLPLVANLTDDNGDGAIDAADVPDVVVQEYLGGFLFALDGASGSEHFRAPIEPPYGSDHAIIDLDGDHRPEIVAYDSLRLVAYDAAGKLLWRAEQVDGLAWDNITLADLDHDGSVEILTGNAIFDAHGNLVRKLTESSDVGPALAVDLDGDGELEIYYGASVYRRDGTLMFSVPGVARSFGQVADLDGDRQPELVIVSEQEVIVLAQDGRELHRVALASVYPQLPGDVLSPALIADFDGDGRDEIGLVGHDDYRVLDGNLKLLWSTPTSYGGAYTGGSTAFDFEGDGRPEIVFADQYRLHVFDGATGIERAGIDLALPPRGYPVIVDVDNDGSAEIVLAMAGSDTAPAQILVYGAAQGRFMPARRIWNQYDYFVTHVTEDARSPLPEPRSWLQTNTFRAQAQVDAKGSLCVQAGRPQPAL